MRWVTKRDKGTDQDPSVLGNVGLSVDCVTKEGFPVHVQAVVKYRIDDSGGGAKRARRAAGADAAGASASGNASTSSDSGAAATLNGLAHDIFVRHLRAVVETFAWDEILRERLRLTEQIDAAGEHEMSEIGLRIDSLDMRALDFPYDSEPAAILRAAQAKVRAESRDATEVQDRPAGA